MGRGGRGRGFFLGFDLAPLEWTRPAFSGESEDVVFLDLFFGGDRCGHEGHEG